MKSTKNTTIAKKIILLTILFSSAITLVFTCIQLGIEFSQEKSAIQSTLDDITSESYLKPLNTAVWTLDAKQIEHNIEAISKRPYITYIELSQTEKYTHTIGTKPDQFFITKEVDLKFSPDSDLEPEVIGKLTITSDYKPLIFKLFAKLATIFTFNAIKTFFVAIFILILFQRLITRHLLALSESASKISLDSKELVKVNSIESIPEKNEITTLYRSLQSMQKNLIQSIEENKDKEEIIRQSQKMDSLGQLVSSIAHDFKNILFVIDGNLSLMRKKISPEDPLEKNLKRIENASRTGLDLVLKLNSFSRKDAVKAEITNINKILNEHRDMLSLSIDKSTMELVYEFQEDVWDIQIDINEFLNAMINMCVNTKDALAGNSGKISIQTQNFEAKNLPAIQNGQYVKMVFSDNGPGIPASVISKIFEPFFTTKEKGKGTGLGLSQVYGFVKQSKAHIFVESLENIGTHFIFLFPRAVDQNDSYAEVSH